jgi:hypothetical protein
VIGCENGSIKLFLVDKPLMTVGVQGLLQDIEVRAIKNFSGRLNLAVLLYLTFDGLRQPGLYDAAIANARTSGPASILVTGHR